VLDPDGTFTYAPAENFNGSDSFTYHANDGTNTQTIDNFGISEIDTADSNVVTVTVTVNAVNDAPVALGDAYSTNEDATLAVDNGESGNVLDNDTDVDHDSLTALLDTNVSNGVLVLDPDGTFTYAPADNFNGIDTFTYHAEDGTEGSTANSNVVTVTITIKPLNDAPVAIDGTASTSEDHGVAIDLGASASDVETSDGNLTYTIVAGPSDGVLTGEGQNQTYTPTADFDGSDSFTFTVTDRGDPDACGELVLIETLDTPDPDACTAALTSEIKTITITIAAVNDAPVALADAYATDEDTTLAVDNGESGNVLDNDTDIDSTSLTAVLDTNVSHGVLVLDPDGTFTYAPGNDFNGTDTFTYHANDGTTSYDSESETYLQSDTANSNTVTVTITVNPVNDAVIAVADELAVVEDTTTSLDVLANDIDVDLDTLHVLFVGGASHGLAYIPVGRLTVGYIPDTNYNGPDSFDYTVTDGHGTSSSTTVTVTVTPVNDAPVAVADLYATDEETTLNVTTENGLLLNDSDVDHDTLHAILVTEPGHGTLDLAGDGSFRYVPAADYAGTDTFTYRASDGTESDTALGNIVTVTITIGGLNDAPVAVADAYTAAEDTASTGNVLTNDTDVDHDTLHAVLLDDVENGALTLNGDGTFSYLPAADFNGTDSFTYRANDGTVSSNTVTVDFTISAVNDAPVAVADSF
jgi:VCBS repeat-containing protein